MRAIVYSRVSTDAQERHGTSLDTQERACLDFARQQGWRVVETIRDTASGYTLDRPGMGRVRRLIRENAADVVVSYAVDRLARDEFLGFVSEQCDAARNGDLSSRNEDEAKRSSFLRRHGHAAVFILARSASRRWVLDPPSRPARIFRRPHELGDS